MLNFPCPEVVANLCFTKFKSLPKTGKPSVAEWTVLAGVVLHNSNNGTNEVISLGSGTKCIGRSKLCPKGLILNDSHGEILSRRALLRYFYHHIKKVLRYGDSGDTIFEWLEEQKKCKLKDGLSFHFFSSQTPCGDACIIDFEDSTEGPSNKKSKLENSPNEDSNVDCGDIVYTGAKLLGSNHADLIKQTKGAVRTKPGRGERTLSMSCSDKLSKWQVMGLQGALLDVLLDAPIYFETLNFCGNDYKALERAIWKRFENNDYNHEKFKLHVPKIRVCIGAEFQHIQDENKQPSPNGLVWCNIPESLKPYEISVNGKRQGVTSKKLNSPQAALAVAKFNLFKGFLDIVKLKPELLAISEDLEFRTYLEAKLMSTGYQQAWSELKNKYFKQWSQKPDDVLKFSFRNIEITEDNKTMK